MRTRELFREVAPDYHPKFDPWGHTMGAFFDVAGEMDLRGLSIPAKWGYRAGWGGPDVSEWNAEYLATLSDGELLKLGRFCHKLTDKLDRLGLSY